MKSLSIKLPVDIAQHMDDNARLNPNWLTGFILLNKDKAVTDSPVKGLCINYTFKVDPTLHKQVKLAAIERELPLNEFIARLLTNYYM